MTKYNSAFFNEIDKDLNGLVDVFGNLMVSGKNEKRKNEKRNNKKTYSDGKEFLAKLSDTLMNGSVNSIAIDLDDTYGKFTL